MLDNDLPSGAYLKVTLPETLSHVPEACHHWEVDSGSLASPTPYTFGTTTNSGTLSSGVSGTYYCSFATELSANTAYALALPRSTSTAKAGVYAPVALTTRMNKETTNIGPVLDANPVFDSVAVGVAAVDFTLTVTKSAAINYPGESYSATFAFEFGNFAPSTKIAAPYNIVMTLGKSPA
jgi:hypothetical protein